MVDELIIQKINTMPLVLKKEVDDFIDFLIAKHLKNNQALVGEKELRPIGTLKGLLLHIADDFDAPMNDFEDYM